MSKLPPTIRILHVDDDPAFLDVTATALEREHDRFVIETATTARDGLDTLRETDIDCVVADYDMSGQNGIEFLETVREESPDIPFILFTGKGSESIASDAITAGVTDYLQKDGDTSQFTVLGNRILNAVEQYHATHALEASQKRLSLFVEQSPLGVIEWDDTFTVVDSNDAAAEILGYSAAQLRGKSWQFIVPESDRDVVDEVVSTLLEAEGGYHSINENVRADGERIICEWHNRVVTDDDGEVVAIFSQFQDITERKQHERQLEETTARLEALFEESPDMIDIHDAEGTIVDTNPRLAEKTGYDREELVGMQVWDLDQSVDSDEITDVWQEMDEGDQRRLEGQYRCKDGSTVPVEVHIRRIDLAGTDRFVVISRDITDQKARERELRQQNERLDDFASVISHDLRNPLNVAGLRLDLAMDECNSDHLDDVSNALDRMESLVEDLLVLAREGERAENMEPVDLANLAEQCWQTIETSDAVLVTDIDCQIRADQSQLQQLFENLVQNAVEHGGPDVTITITGIDGGFAIEDDGPGITDQQHDQIFEAGYSTAEEGIGLGLRIVERVVNAHGWEIQVTESAEGGARFEITGVEAVDY
ncbi:PAS domain S-box protein [Halovenus marina]|uniref:PAS domain S-box protein n=1 Tax=Halovenus marina TaxID=3396621 RepID=UPI003F561390